MSAAGPADRTPARLSRGTSAAGSSPFAPAQTVRCAWLARYSLGTGAHHAARVLQKSSTGWPAREMGSTSPSITVDAMPPC